MLIVGRWPAGSYKGCAVVMEAIRFTTGSRHLLLKTMTDRPNSIRTKEEVERGLSNLPRFRSLRSSEIVSVLM